jgi:hypothetical protein
MPRWSATTIAISSRRCATAASRASQRRSRMPNHEHVCVRGQIGGRCQAAEVHN